MEHISQLLRNREDLKTKGENDLEVPMGKTTPTENLFLASVVLIKCGIRGSILKVKIEFLPRKGLFGQCGQAW